MSCPLHQDHYGIVSHQLHPMLRHQCVCMQSATEIQGAISRGEPVSKVESQSIHPHVSHVLTDFTRGIFTKEIIASGHVSCVTGMPDGRIAAAGFGHFRSHIDIWREYTDGRGGWFREESIDVGLRPVDCIIAVQNRIICVSDHKLFIFKLGVSASLTRALLSNMAENDTFYRSKKDEKSVKRIRLSKSLADANRIMSFVGDKEFFEEFSDATKAYRCLTPIKFKRNDMAFVAVNSYPGNVVIFYFEDETWKSQFVGTVDRLPDFDVSFFTVSILSGGRIAVLTSGGAAIFSASAASAAPAYTRHLLKFGTHGTANTLVQLDNNDIIIGDDYGRIHMFTEHSMGVWTKYGEKHFSYFMQTPLSLSKIPQNLIIINGYLFTSGLRSLCDFGFDKHADISVMPDGRIIGINGRNIVICS